MESGFLIVEDRPVLARSLARRFGQHRPVKAVHTLAAAREELALQSQWTGIVLDLLLPDGYGLDLLAEVRERYGMIPVLVLTGEFNRDVVNRVQALRAEYVAKPARAENLRRFIKAAITQEGVDDKAVGQRIDHISKQLHLSRRETELLTHAVDGMPRRDIAKAMGVAENTVKAQIRSLLKKSGARSLATLAQQVLRGNELTTVPSSSASPRS